MKFKVGQKVGIISKHEVVFGNVRKIKANAGENWTVVGFGTCTVEAANKFVFPVWDGGAFGERGFNSLAWSLHDVGLRDLETKARLMLEGLTGYGIFCFCTELQEAIDNGIFNKEPHSQMIAENFLDWAAHGFQGGAA